MNNIVVDSSVIAKWFVPEVDSAQALRVMTETHVTGGRLIVLDLIFVEVSNVIWKKHRRNELTLAEARASLSDLMQCAMHTRAAKVLVHEALEIAVKYDRAVYDALFVALARNLGLRGVTADERLYNATDADFPEIVLLRDW